MKIIFMGTPQFACNALEKLIADKQHEIVAVYTKEPQPSGRGHKLTNSAIHELALKHSLQVFTPKTLRDSQVQQEFINLKADIAVVVAYGLILPQEILNGTKHGCINIHPSLLPKFRGAAPMQRTIMSGDKESAVAIIAMNEGLDSGDILALEKFTVDDEMNYNDFAAKAANIGSQLMMIALNDIAQQKVTRSKQDESLVTYAKKISKEECKINWQNSCVEINRQIRALSGNLTAYFFYDNEKIKIHQAKIIDDQSAQHKVGTIVDDKFTIQCANGLLMPTILQRQGKNAINIKDFLLGFKPEIGKILS